MHRPITYDNMTSTIVEAVPELIQTDTAERAWWAPDDPPPHPYYATVVVPYLTSLLEGEDQEEVLSRIFSFLEALATHDDERVSNVVVVSVCETVIQETRWIHRARTFMGPKTLSLSYLAEPADWPHIRDAKGFARIFWRAYYRVWYRRRFYRLGRLLERFERTVASKRRAND